MKPYVVRRLRPAALIPVAITVVVALAGPIGVPIPWPFVVIWAAFAAYVTWQASLVISVDAGGVRFMRGMRHSRGQSVTHERIPWTSIAEVVLTESDPPEFALRLRHGAPLPRGVQGMIHDPSQPYVSVPSLRVTLPRDRVDRAALSAAVEAFGRIPLRTA